MAADRVYKPIQQSSRARGSSSPTEIPRRTLLAAGASLSVAEILSLVGPRPVSPAHGRSGDAALLALAEPHLRGLNRVALAYLDADTTRYAGVGADQRTPFEIGSVSKTFRGAPTAYARTRPQP